MLRWIVRVHINYFHGRYVQLFKVARHGSKIAVVLLEV